MFTTRTLPPLTSDELAESDLVTLGCDTCRSRAGLLPLHPERIADNTEYYCPTCHTQWFVTDSWRDRWPPLDAALFAITYLLFLFGVMVGILYLITADFVARYGDQYVDQSSYMVAVGVGALCWIAVILIVTNAMWHTENLIRLAVCWVWGRPLWDYEPESAA